MTRLVERPRGGPALETAPPAVSVAIPVLDGGRRLLDLLDAIWRQDGLCGTVEVLLADSGSRDGAAEEALRRWPGIRLLDVLDGFDHGLVRTALVESARAPLVALFSQDAVPRGRRFLRVIAAPFAEPVVAGAWARQVPGPGADRLVRATVDRWCPSPALVGIAPVIRRTTKADLDAMAPAEAMEAARFDNVASMVRRETVLALPFPARPFGEDLAWGAAALRAGFALAYVPTAVVEHHHDLGLGGTFERHRAAHRQARAEFGILAVPSLPAAAIALLAGLPADARAGGPLLALATLPRRGAALLGQWAGARRADREGKGHAR